MAYGKIKNGVVIQKQPHPKKDFIEIPDHVVPGYLYQDGEFIAPEPESIPEESLEPAFDVLTYQVNKQGSNLSSGQFYDRIKVHNWTVSSGNWGGWSNNIDPLIIPYNCKLIHAYINFRDASFDWRDEPGDIYLDVGFIDHAYNSIFNERILRFELEDSFEGGSSGQNSFRFSVNENKITTLLGENKFVGGEMIGLLLRSDGSIPGRIYSISYPFHSFVFREV